MKLVYISEIEYSVSPGGVDTWALEVADQANWNEFYQEGFSSAGEALEFAINKYPKEELKVQVKSLAWYHAKEEAEVK